MLIGCAIADQKAPAKTGQRRWHTLLAVLILRRVDYRESAMTWAVIQFPSAAAACYMVGSLEYQFRVAFRR